MTSSARILAFRSVISSFIGSLRRFGCTADARGRSGAAPEIASRRTRRLPASIVEDIIAGLAFALIFIGGVFIAWGMS